jgi:DNA mismatch repair protein MutS2
VDVHALHALEFERVRDLLVNRAASTPGRERAQRVGPEADASVVLSLLAAVKETCALRLRHAGWPEMAFPDLGDALNQCRVEGSVLDPQQFLAVTRMLLLAQRCHSFFKTDEQREQFPSLAEMVTPLILERDFPRKIERSFEPSGEVRDEASSQLKSIRSRKRRYQLDVGQRLEKLSRDFRQSGEDSVVTMRNGRQVISVAATGHRRLPGIVHDRSATGKTVYLEPFDLVPMNNDLAEIEREEQVEIYRILQALTGWVRERFDSLRRSCDLLARLDELNARARLAEDLQATLPRLDAAAGTLRIVQGRHPLLQLSVGKDVVPLQLSLESGSRNLVISGPNMGGKTVVLKTVGLLIAMAMSGLFVPAADGTIIPMVDAIFVDIGDEQSLDSDLSTYAGHLRNMKAIIAGASNRSIALIDELGAGTDPDEGAALGIALLSEVGRRGSLSITTTHLGAFKTFAADTAGFANAAMKHDPASFKPTYELALGLPGRSHAFELASREAWPDEILEDARSRISGDRLQSESLLVQIQTRQHEMDREIERLQQSRQALEKERLEAKQLTDDLKKRLAEMKKAQIVEENKRLAELKSKLAEAKATLATLSEMQRSETTTDQASLDLKQLRRETHRQERDAAELAKSQTPLIKQDVPEAGEPLNVDLVNSGDHLYSLSLQVEVDLIEIEQGGKRAWVLHRGLKVRVPFNDLRTTAAGKRGNKAPVVQVQTKVTENTRDQVIGAVAFEIDFRGQDLESCQQDLDLYIDRVLLAGLGRIRIIHGKGTGVLRRGVHKFLKRHGKVDWFREGEPGEGGWGVTIAFMKNAAGLAAGKAARQND